MASLRSCGSWSRRGGLFLPSLISPHYTLGEKMRLWRGKFSSGVSALWDEMLAADLTDRVPQVTLPAYFFHGAYGHRANSLHFASSV